MKRRLQQNKNYKRQTHIWVSTHDPKKYTTLLIKWRPTSHVILIQYNIMRTLITIYLTIYIFNILITILTLQ